MPESNEKLDQLQTRLENLEKYEAGFKREIAAIRYEIQILKNQDHSQPRKTEESKTSGKPEVPQPKPAAVAFPAASGRPDPRRVEAPAFGPYTERPAPKTDKQPQAGTPGLEQYIGKYLISIIGILVTVLGVGIGAKYAIDNNWITPMMRIVFGYAVGLGLAGFAVRLKEKYITFSAVLLSGGMAIMYFISYFAYVYYEILSQTSAFSLMVIFTIFTVASAILYDRQIIAVIGLVGGYAVPFLLSSGSGRVDILFSYIALINFGILAVSLKKYWKYLFYLAFLFTWLIYRSWLAGLYVQSEHFGLASIFLTVFFAVFYATFLGFRVIHKNSIPIEMMALIVLNSLVFFGLGYSILNTHGLDNLLGLFTISNAFVHYAVAASLYKTTRFDRTTFYLLVVLVLTFLTIAIPIQTKGNWITLFWLAEGAFLFLVGRTKKIRIFEIVSGMIVTVGLISLAGGWIRAMDQQLRWAAEAITPLLNGNFATSIFAVISLALIYIVFVDKRYASPIVDSMVKPLQYLIAGSFLIVLYNTFRIEITNYYYVQAVQTAVNIPLHSIGQETYVSYDNSLGSFSIIWQIVYTLFFLSVLSFANITRLKNTLLGYVSIVLNLLTAFVFLTVGLWELGNLRRGEISQVKGELFVRGPWNIAIRYVAIALFLVTLVATYKYLRQEFITRVVPERYLVVVIDLFACFSFFVLLSNELLLWTEVLTVNESDKIGLSLLWGVYALALVLAGIFRRKKHIRIFAIGLFALTLIKLFFYDIASLDTVRKTIVFVATGLLLLVASYLYNRFTKLIVSEQEP
ncbi:MAG: DUF2339 domain-containing protein [Acidobacteria bacterium]|nr:DUF2339 domain-containing protein [Acidobacteriota bacterium]